MTGSIQLSYGDETFNFQPCARKDAQGYVHNPAT